MVYVHLKVHHAVRNPSNIRSFINELKRGCMKRTQNHIAPTHFEVYKEQRRDADHFNRRTC